MYWNWSGEEETAEGLGGQLIGLGGEVLVLPQVAVDGGVNPAVDHVADELPHVLSVQHLAALLIDDLALDVHHVVVFQGMLSGLEVLGLHLFWAFSMAPERILASMGVSSSIFRVSIMFCIRSVPNRRMMSSSRER